MAGAKEVEMPESLRCSFQRRLLFPQMSAEFRLHFHLLRFFLLWVGKEKKPHMKIQRVHFEALRPLRGPLHQLRGQRQWLNHSLNTSALNSAHKDSASSFSDSQVPAF